MASRDPYTGKAGERAVVSHLLMRGWNVAVPEVDVGDDLFVAQRGTAFVPVQVKTARATERRHYHTGRFLIPVKQLITPRRPDLVYVFAVFRDTDWSDFVVLPRPRLHDQRDVDGVGGTSGSRVLLTISFGQDVRCSGHDWSRYRNNWSLLAGTDIADDRAL